ncbi:type II toxin-antitoxin system Phd/YefM family antitoxin [Actinomycetospora sp. TBRC 11914]|uniref:type II toxin-antitoxin system Phd/YefM family antitoxin n=1 Tax=Actinomycetospora sp. TBRC 11914 TaxID=2729387 RepID=UPI00145F6BB3|nr:type II toxin-antitoxin system prevent-host-death family antitoxin [Actinomycetospora sp. TBRC 11914]NMO89167.1 type II toxin-antitoxin system Phd/YefM family antitoxin [Actinomycetospora sp. TBRC 11914]
MTEIASRELRNDTAGVLRRVEAGETLTVTSNGRPVAQLVPVPRAERRWMTREELVRVLHEAQADPGLRDDLRELAGETTDDLGPIR